MLNDDMLFLLDSVLGELTAADCEILLVLHPLLTVARDGKGQLEYLLPKLAEDEKHPSRAGKPHPHPHKAYSRTAATG